MALPQYFSNILLFELICRIFSLLCTHILVDVLINVSSEHYYVMLQIGGPCTICRYYLIIYYLWIECDFRLHIWIVTLIMIRMMVHHSIFC
jgi:hypothetical protein